MRQLLARLFRKFDHQSKILFKNTSWIFGSNTLKSLLTFLRSIIIARGLGIEFYGIYVLITSFVTATQDFFNLNIGTAFIKYGGDFKAENREDKIVALAKGCILGTLITACLSVMLITLLVTFAYDRVISRPGLETFIILYAIADVATFFDPMGRSVLRLYYKFKVNAIVQSITSALEVIVVAIVILIYPKQLEPFFIAFVSVKILNMLLNNGIMVYEMRNELLPYIKAPLSLLKDQWRSIGGFVAGNSLTKTLQTIITQGDVLLLGAMAGPAPVAYYNIGKRLANMTLVAMDPFTYSIYPQLARLLAEKKFKETKLMLVKLTRSLFYLSAVLFVIMFFIREPFIQLLYGKDYLPGADSFIILLFGILASTVFFWNQSFVQSIGKIRYRFWVHLAAILSGLFLAWLLIPVWGTVGLALGVASAKILITICFGITAVKYLNQKPELTNGT